MGAQYSYYVKFIATTYAPQEVDINSFLGNIRMLFWIGFQPIVDCVGEDAAPTSVGFMGGWPWKPSLSSINYSSWH